MHAEKPNTGVLLKQILGNETALKLMRSKGVAGCQIEIPKFRAGRGEKKCDLLSSVIGEEATESMIYHFGGERLYIPRDYHYFVALRNRAIVQAYDQGATPCELAVQFGMSDRQIRIILKKTDMTAELA